MKKKVYDLKKRTYLYALEIIRFLEGLPRDYVTQTIGKQLLRSATSIGANYLLPFTFYLLLLTFTFLLLTFYFLLFTFFAIHTIGFKAIRTQRRAHSLFSINLAIGGAIL